MTGDRSKPHAIPVPSAASHAKINTYPRWLFRSYILRRSVQPRALREASLSRTGGRWPRTGATRTPNARRPKPRGPGRRLGQGIWRPLRAKRQTARAAVKPRAVGRFPGGGLCSRKPRKPERDRPPGVSRSKPQTSRAGRWREDEPAVLFPDCLRAARREGPWVFRNPGVPRALGLFRARNVNGKARARMRCENAWPCLRSIVAAGMSLCQAFCAAA